MEKQIITLQELIMKTKLPEELEKFKEYFSGTVSFCSKYVFIAYCHQWDETREIISGELCLRKEVEAALEKVQRIQIPEPEKISPEESQEYYADIINRVDLRIYPFIYNYPLWKKENLTFEEILGSQVIMENVENYGVIPFLTDVMNNLMPQNDLSSTPLEYSDDGDVEIESDEESEEEMRQALYFVAKNVAENAKKMRKLAQKIKKEY